MPNVEHHRLGEPHEAGLARVVPGPAGEEVLPGQRTDVDDVAVTAVGQVRKGGLREIEDPSEVHVDLTLPLIDRHVRDGFEDAESGVVHQYVEATKVAHRLGDEPYAVLRSAHITGDPDRRITKTMRDLGNRLRTPRGDHDGHARIDHALRDRQSYALGTACHDRDLARQVRHECLVFVVLGAVLDPLHGAGVSP